VIKKKLKILKEDLKKLVKTYKENKKTCGTLE
jgi:hypothetical protein